jgi:hypothetical protein
MERESYLQFSGVLAHTLVSDMLVLYGEDLLATLRTPLAGGLFLNTCPHLFIQCIYR